MLIPNPRLRPFDFISISILILSVMMVLCAGLSNVSAQDDLVPVEDSAQGVESNRSAVTYYGVVRFTQFLCRTISAKITPPATATLSDSA